MGSRMDAHRLAARHLVREGGEIREVGGKPYTYEAKHSGFRGLRVDFSISPEPEAHVKSEYGMSTGVKVIRSPHDPKESIIVAPPASQSTKDISAIRLASLAKEGFDRYMLGLRRQRARK